jgi:hypothetical protein
MDPVYPWCLSVKIIWKSRSALKRKKKTTVPHPLLALQKNKTKIYGTVLKVEIETLPTTCSASLICTATRAVPVFYSTDQKRICAKHKITAQLN